MRCYYTDACLYDGETDNCVYAKKTFHATRTVPIRCIF